MLTVKDVANKMDVCDETVRRWIKSGKLVAVKSSNRIGYSVSEQDLFVFATGIKYQERSETIVEINEEISHVYKHLNRIERLLRSLDL